MNISGIRGTSRCGGTIGRTLGCRSRVIIRRFMANERFSINLVNNGTLPPVRVTPGSKVCSCTTGCRTNTAIRAYPTSVSRRASGGLHSTTARTCRTLRLRDCTQVSFLLSGNNFACYLRTGALPNVAPADLLPRRTTIRNVDCPSLYRGVVRVSLTGCPGRGSSFWWRIDVGSFALTRVTGTYGNRCINSRSLGGAGVASIRHSDQRIGGKDLFLTVGNRHISNRSFVRGYFTRNTIYTLYRGTPRGTAGPYVIISSALSTIGGVNETCERGFSVPIVKVSNDIKGASAGRVLCTILSRGFGARGARNGLGGRLNIPLALLSVPRSARTTIVRVNVSSFNRVAELSRVIRPAVYILAVVNRYRLRGLNSHSNILGTGARVFEGTHRGTSFVLGNSSSGLSAIGAMGNGGPIFFKLSTGGSFCTGGVGGDNSNGILTALYFSGGGVSIRVPTVNACVIAGTLTTTTTNGLLKLASRRVTGNITSCGAMNDHTGIVGANGVGVVSSYCGTGPASIETSLSALSGLSNEGITVLNSVGRLKDRRLGLRFSANICTGSGNVNAIVAMNRLTGRLTGNTSNGTFSAVRSTGPRVLGAVGDKSIILIGTSRSVRFRGVIRFLGRGF